MSVILLLVVVLLDSTKGSEQMFVKSKTDLLLNINRTGIPNSFDFFWKFNVKINVVKFNSGQDPKLLNNYDKRAEFFKQNYSLLLKNMQHDDSGSYTAVVSGDEDVPISEYKVTVQDPVSPVKLTINPSVSDGCNVTATCRTDESLVSKTFQCDNQTCSLVTKPNNTATSSSVRVYVQQNYIVCNHSNQVSSELDKKDFTALCETKPAVSAAGIVGISAGVLLVVLIISIFLLHIYCKRKRSDKTVSESTNPDPNTYENPAAVNPDVCPSTTYSLVQFPKRAAQEEESRPKAQPETVYAQINRLSKPNSAAPAVSS